MIKKFSCKKIFFSIYFVYIGEEKNKGGINMKIKPTNDLLFKKMMTTIGKDIFWKTSSRQLPE